MCAGVLEQRRPFGGIVQNRVKRFEKRRLVLGLAPVRSVVERRGRVGGVTVEARVLLGVAAAARNLGGRCEGGVKRWLVRSQ